MSLSRLMCYLNFNSRELELQYVILVSLNLRTIDLNTPGISRRNTKVTKIKHNMFE